MMYANINRNKQEISLIIGKCYLNRDIEKRTIRSQSTKFH
jgi:hypothetical protein